MSTYSVDPDDYGHPLLWEENVERPEHSVELARLTADGDTQVFHPDNGVVFRAAAAVLAPDEALRLRLAEAMFEANGGGSWHALGLGYRDQWVRSAHAALTTLRAHVEGSQS